ncbi:MAG: hypothetical protein ACRDVL_05720 [Acidimicrobiia bacterium]
MTVVKLSLPPRPELLHVIRSVTTSVAASVEMPLDAVEEFCIAVDEAATMLLTARGVSEALSVHLDLDGGELHAIVSGDAKAAQWPPARFEDGFAWRVLYTLTDTQLLTNGADGPQVRLSKKVPDLV